MNTVLWITAHLHRLCNNSAKSLQKVINNTSAIALQLLCNSSANNCYYDVCKSSAISLKELSIICLQHTYKIQNCLQYYCKSSAKALKYSERNRQQYVHRSKIVNPSQGSSDSKKSMQRTLPIAIKPWGNQVFAATISIKESIGQAWKPVALQKQDAYKRLGQSWDAWALDKLGSQ
jgi:hypothetical protein